MPCEYKLSSEQSLEQQYNDAILPFWQQIVQEQRFHSDDEIDIAYAYCLHPEAKATIVLSPGRTEGYLKYKEFFYDMYQNGYSVFAIDHRGQGLSGRLIDHPQKGYVDDFQHYVDDLEHFCHHIVKPKANAPLCLLGHSMGATIATLYLEQHKNEFIASAMSAPLYGFNPGFMPVFVAKPLSKILIALKTMIGRSSDYFFGQFDYCRIPFNENKLTHCEARYEMFRKQYEQEPALRLGGITFHWLATTLRAMNRLFSELEKISTPMLIIQSYDDEVVNLSDQTRFFKRLQQTGICEKIELHGAKHEVFFETDLMRSTAIKGMLSFFEQHLGIQQPS